MSAHKTPPRFIDAYIPLVQFLGEFIGPNCEIVLHDTTSKENSVLAIANNHITGRRKGAPLTDLALKFLKTREYERRDWVMGYVARSKDDRPLHSATYFIRDNNELAGMLCLNMDLSDMINARDTLNRIISFVNKDSANAKDAPDQSETFSESIEDLTENLIEQIINRAEIPPKRMTAAEKMDLVRVLDERGVFLLKGTVAVVADRLAASEATIYRYLQKIHS